MVLLTPAFGPRAPVIQGSAEIVLQTFPPTTPNVDLSAVVTAVGANGGEPIPPGGAIIQAAGSLAAKLQAEAPVGTRIAARLILQPGWTTVVAALGGGPVLVRNSVPVFRSLEDFTNDQIAARSPRAGVGQLADGRVILVAVDGDQPGYSVGLTSFELAQTMAGLGAVTAAAVESGPGRDARVRRAAAEPAERCRRRACRQGGAARAVLRRLRTAAAAAALLTGEAGKTQEQLSYKIVRPSQVTAQLIGPDGRPRVLEAGVQHVPGSYSFTYSDVRRRGDVALERHRDRRPEACVDDRPDVPVRHDAPWSQRPEARPRDRSRSGSRCRALRACGCGSRRRPVSSCARCRPVSLPAGAQAVVWDGRLPHGSRAYGGSYVAHVFVTSSVGTSEFFAPFSFRRTG